MDEEEYRRQYEAQLREAAQRRTPAVEVLEKARSAAQSGPDGVLGAGEPPSDSAALAAFIGNDDESTKDRIIAINALTPEIAGDQELIDMLLDLLRNADQPERLREAALKVLQASSLRSALFAPMRSAYLDTLRAIVEDTNATLRRRAIEILALEKDAFVQQRLLEGLENPSRALVTPQKAIQLLGHDIHGEHYELLRRIVRNPPNSAAKREALRLMAADPGASEILADVLLDKSEQPDVRRISAAALQALNPDSFERCAKQIVADTSEPNGLQAALLEALELFADPAALGEDADFTAQVARLGQQTGSRDLRRASANYMAKVGSH